MKIFILETIKGEHDFFKKDGIASYNSSKNIKEQSTIDFIRENIGDNLDFLAIGIHINSQDLPKHPSLLKIHKIDFINEINGQKTDTHFRFKYLEDLINHTNDSLLHSLPINNYGKLVYTLDSDKVPNDISENFGQTSLISERNFQSKENILNINLFENTDWQTFEKNTSIIFNILGFQVDLLGAKAHMQRVPDMYLYAPKIFKNNMFWVTVDCKYSNDYYPVADDIRAFQEYINKRKESIDYELGIPSEEGYFLFIAKSFAPNIDRGLLEIFDLTKLKGGAINYDNLLDLVEKKLRMGYKFYLPKITKLFNNMLINNVEINRIFPKEDEFH